MYVRRPNPHPSPASRPRKLAPPKPQPQRAAHGGASQAQPGARQTGAEASKARHLGAAEAVHMRPEARQAHPAGPETGAEQAGAGGGSEAGGSLVNGIRGWMQQAAGDLGERIESLGGQLEQVGEKAKKMFMEKTGLAPNEEEMGHMQAVHDMLGPDKLGGKDGTFNQNDTDAVADSIGRDIGGIKGRIGARVARGQINEGLAAEGVKPAHNEPDATRRSVTRKEMEGFEGHVKGGLEAYGKRVAQNPFGKLLGLDKPMRPPAEGLGQGAVRDIMNGRPPQGWVEDKRRAQP